MIVTCVHVKVKPENITDFKNACQANHDASVQEPGNLRFDILQEVKDTSRFLLYEAYESDEAAAAHKNTQHYATWRDTVAPWMADPREGIKYAIITPTDKTLW